MVSSHIPVLLHEVIRYLDPKPGEFMIDGTVGDGGHAKRILERVTPNGILLAIDWDKNALDDFAHSVQEKISHVVCIHGNYAELPRILLEQHLPLADGLLLDLGFSSSQLEHSGRGFSFLKDERLSMTYDGSRKPVRTILRECSEQELRNIIRRYGEEKFAGRIAKAVKERERRKPIETSGELAGVIEKAVPRSYEHGRIHPATRTFQALRMYANNELGNLETLLSSLPRLMRRGGRVVVVSFHSLEDRLVKTHFKNLSKEGTMTLITQKPIHPSAQEQRENPRSRSAKLRAAIMHA